MLRAWRKHTAAACWPYHQLSCASFVPVVRMPSSLPRSRHGLSTLAPTADLWCARRLHTRAQTLQDDGTPDNSIPHDTNSSVVTTSTDEPDLPRRARAITVGGVRRGQLVSSPYPLLRTWQDLQSIGELTGYKSMDPHTDQAELHRWMGEKNVMVQRLIHSYFTGSGATHHLTFKLFARRRLQVMRGDVSEILMCGRTPWDLLTDQPGVDECLYGRDPLSVDLQVESQRAIDAVFACCRIELIQLGLWGLLEKFDRAKVGPLTPDSADPADEVDDNAGADDADGTSNSKRWRKPFAPTPEQVESFLVQRWPDAWQQIRPPPTTDPWSEWTFQDWTDLAAAECALLQRWQASGEDEPTLPDLSSEYDQSQLRAAEERGRSSPFTPAGRASVAPDQPPLLPSALAFDVRQALKTVFPPPAPKESKESKNKRHVSFTPWVPRPGALQVTEEMAALWPPAPTGTEFRINEQQEHLSIFPTRAEAKHAPILFLAAHETSQRQVRDRMEQIRIQEGAMLQLIKEERRRGLVFRVNPPSADEHGQPQTDEQEDASAASAASALEEGANINDENINGGDGASAEEATDGDAPQPRSYVLVQFGTREFRIDRLFARLVREERNLALLAQAYILELEQKRRDYALSQPERDRLERERELADEKKRGAKRQARKARRHALKPVTTTTPVEPKPEPGTKVRMSDRIVLIRSFMEHRGVSMLQAIAELQLDETPDLTTAAAKKRAKKAAQEASNDAPTAVDAELTFSEASPINTPDEATPMTSTMPTMTMATTTSIDDAVADGALLIRSSLLTSLPRAATDPSSSSLASLLPTFHRPIPVLPDANLPAAVPLVILLDAAARKKYIFQFQFITFTIQSIEEAIREFVRQHQEAGRWDEMVEARVQELAQRKAAGGTDEKTPSSGTFDGDDSQGLEFLNGHWSNLDHPLRMARNRIDTMPENVVDLFLQYRTTRAIPYALFDDIAKLPDDELDGSTVPRASGLSVPATPSSPIFLQGAFELRQRLYPDATTADETTPPPQPQPVMSVAQRLDAIDTDASNIFYHHLLHLNPGVSKEMRRVLAMPATTPDEPTPSHDKSNYEHLTRPASVRCGLMPFPHSLAICTFPEPIIKHQTSIRMLPWLLLDTWRLLVQSAYLRAYPSAFGGVGPHDLYAVRARRDVPDRLLYAVQAATSGANAATTAVEARDAVNQPQSDKPKRPNNDSARAYFNYLQQRYDWSLARTTRVYELNLLDATPAERADELIRHTRYLRRLKARFTRLLAAAAEPARQEQLQIYNEIAPGAQKIVDNLIAEAGRRLYEKDNTTEATSRPSTLHTLCHVLQLCLRLPYVVYDLTNNPREDPVHQLAADAERRLAEPTHVGHHGMTIQAIEYVYEHVPDSEGPDLHKDAPKYLITMPNISLDQMKFINESIRTMLSPRSDAPTLLSSVLLYRLVPAAEIPGGDVDGDTDAPWCEIDLGDVRLVGFSGPPRFTIEPLQWRMREALAQQHQARALRTPVPIVKLRLGEPLTTEQVQTATSATITKFQTTLNTIDTTQLPEASTH